MTRSLLGAVGLALASSAALAACGTTSALTTTPHSPNAAVTHIPGYVAPSGEPTLPGLATAKPKPGQIVRLAGPFAARYVYSKLAFDGHTLRGVVTVTSDVSTVLDLQVVGGFYDRQGRLLGHAYYTYMNDEMASDAPERNEPQPFVVKVPTALIGTAVSASVGVTDLVNE